MATWEIEWTIHVGNLRRKGIIEIVKKLIDDDEIIKNWRKEEILWSTE